MLPKSIVGNVSQRLVILLEDMNVYPRNIGTWPPSSQLGNNAFIGISSSGGVRKKDIIFRRVPVGGCVQDMMAMMRNVGSPLHLDVPLPPPRRIPLISQ